MNFERLPVEAAQSRVSPEVRPVRSWKSTDGACTTPLSIPLNFLKMRKFLLAFSLNLTCFGLRWVSCILPPHTAVRSWAAPSGHPLGGSEGCSTRRSIITHSICLEDRLPDEEQKRGGLLSCRSLVPIPLPKVCPVTPTSALPKLPDSFCTPRPSLPFFSLPTAPSHLSWLQTGTQVTQ